jgi:hypothetical protein
MRYLSKPVNDFNLIHAMYTRAQAAMYAEDLVVYDDGEREVVEHVRKVVPDICVSVFARALGVETVGLGYAARFVVAAYEVHAVWVAEFETD